MSQDLIQIEGLEKHYGPVAALAGVSLAIAEGEFIALLGPSGCGKTTLLRCIAGFVDPSAGEIRIGGKGVVGVPPHERPVNTVFQNYALFPHLTVTDNVAFGPRRKGVPKQEIETQVREVLAMVGMDGYGDRMPRQLSGGQQQRIALARAIVNRPKVLLLDEPLGALDLKLRKRMQVELKRLHEMLGMTFVYVTHDQEEALVMADRIAVMSQGQIVQIGSGEEIYHQPNSRYVADFIGEANLIDCTVEGGKMSVGGAMLPYAAPEGGSGKATLMVRPEDIQIGAPGGDGVALAGKVRDKVFLGSAWRVYATLATGQEIAAQPSYSDAVEGVAAGAPIQLWWPRGRARVLAR
jgi:spermidine/putrescine transport system ATP-binding protein